MEILFYSIRFVFNVKENNDNFYYNLLKPKARDFIEKNYIPGSFQIISEYYISYKKLKEKLTPKSKIGYYICKDCGELYEIDPCSFPAEISKCRKGHIIGGKNHVCHKKDFRVFYNKDDYDFLRKAWFGEEMDSWFNSFEPLTLQEFKEKFVDDKIPIIEKGIIKNFDVESFKNLDFVRDMNIITFRLLNFILYSFLMSSYIIKSLSEEESKNFLIKGEKPYLFSVIKLNWDLLKNALKGKKVENVQIFMNMVFDYIIEKINNLGMIDSEEKLKSFEKDIDDYIMDIISKQENVEKMNNEYKSLNKELKKISPFSLKEIIKSTFDPSEYEEKKQDYPDMKYYSVLHFRIMKLLLIHSKTARKKKNIS